MLVLLNKHQGIKMDTKDEALKMAIEALEYFEIDYGACDLLLPSNFYKTLNACKEALEQPSVAELNNEYLRDTYVEGLSSAQQPVGWMDSEGRFRLDFRTEIVRNIAAVNKEIPLYTHPAPSWQGLSDDEIDAVWFEVVKENNFEGTGKYFARAIEEALKEKNG